VKKAVFFILLFLLSNSVCWAIEKEISVETKESIEHTTSPSLTLQDCYAMAVQRSETLAIKKEEMARTLASFLHATGDTIGDASFVMTDFRQDSQGGSSSNSSSDSSNFTLPKRRESKFVFSQPLFQGFRAIGALSGAGSLKKQRRGDWERAKQLLFMDVVNSFYDYLRLKKDKEIIEGILSLYQDRITDLNGWIENGRSRPSELATVRSRLGTFEGELARAKGDLAVAKNLLTFLIGTSVAPDELKDQDTPSPADEKFNVSEFVGKRPDVEASRQAIKTARGGVIVAQSDLWPKLSLDSNLYEKREGFQSGNNWDVLFTFNVPLGKGGETLGKIRDSYSQWKESKLTHSLVERTAEREIQDAHDSWKSSAERYQALEKATKDAQENFTLQKDEYSHHLVSNLEVLDALQSLFQTKRDANEAFYDMKKAYWQLDLAKGHCCEDIG